MIYYIRLKKVYIVKNYIVMYIRKKHMVKTDKHRWNINIFNLPFKNDKRCYSPQQMREKRVAYLPGCILFK